MLTIGIVPPWYLLITLIRKPRLLARPKILLLLIGLLLMVVVLSPGAFGLQGFFAAIPLLNAFRWPFRAIPAFHLLLLVLFLCVVVEEKAAPGRLARLLLLVTCVGGSLVSIGHDLALAAEPSRVASWYRAAPMLDDPESWSPPAMERLRKAGFVANVCGHDGRIHMKPRLFFYGNMGAMFGVRTLHLYAVPPFKAYAELDMSIKGCCKRWEGVKKLIEQGPQAPLQGEVSWADPRGPLSFAEVVAKTYIGAVVVDVLNDEAMRYFTSTEGWELVEARATASAFVRRKAEGR
ncbi:MAG: hypothetical protein FJ125_08320 [Deltaproteobacteria bacterium]|nr:hypothetical protein [Deltaproteobacteria bacterium]